MLYGPNGRLTVYKSDYKVDPLTDRVTNVPGTDGEIVWEQHFDDSWPYSVDRDYVLGWNHPGKMQVIDGLLLVSMERWQSVCPTESGAPGSPDEAIFFYDIRDPGNPVYWGSLTRSELGIPDSKPINDVSLFKAGDEYVLLVQDRWFTADQVYPDMSYRTYRGEGIPGGGPTSSHGLMIYSYEDYGRPAAPPRTPR